MRITSFLATTVSLCALLSGSAMAQERSYFFRKPGTGGVLASDIPELGGNNVGKRLVARPMGISETPSAGDSATGSFIALGGTAPYSFVRSGPLPDGVDINPDGTLTGVFARAGSYTLGATATDAKAATSSVSMSVTVRPAPPVIALIPPGSAVAGTPFSASVTQSQGGFLTFSLPTQPGWLGIGGNGAITGMVPSIAQAFSFDVLGTDVYGRSDRRSSGNISVVQPSASVANAPARIVEGDSVSGTFTSNMTGATWAKLSGPAWISVSPTGAVSGQSGDVPAGADTTTSYSARATLGTTTADATANLAIAPATVTLSGLQARSGMAFSLPVSSTMTAAGTFSVAASPSDITNLAVSGSAVVGTAPTVAQASTRAITITKTAAAGGAATSATSSLAIAPRLTFATQPQNMTGKAGTQISAMQPTLAGQVGPTKSKLKLSGTDITDAPSNACPGLTFNKDSAQLAGIPSAACNATNLTIETTDAPGTAYSDTAASNPFSIKISPAAEVPDTFQTVQYNEIKNGQNVNSSASGVDSQNIFNLVNDNNPSTSYTKSIPFNNIYATPSMNFIYSKQYKATSVYADIECSDSAIYFYFDNFRSKFYGKTYKGLIDVPYYEIGNTGTYTNDVNSIMIRCGDVSNGSGTLYYYGTLTVRELRIVP